jgi:hypothetical protein
MREIGMCSYFNFSALPGAKLSRFAPEEAESSTSNASGVYVTDCLGLLAASLITWGLTAAPDYLAAF